MLFRSQSGARPSRYGLDGGEADNEQILAWKHIIGLDDLSHGSEERTSVRKERFAMGIGGGIPYSLIVFGVRHLLSVALRLCERWQRGLLAHENRSSGIKGRWKIRHVAYVRGKPSLWRRDRRGRRAYDYVATSLQLLSLRVSTSAPQCHSGFAPGVREEDHACFRVSATET